MSFLHSIWIACFLYWISMFVSNVFCFNLDSKFPIVYSKGPLNNYFGFSVGLLRNRDGYRALITAPRANSTEVFVGQLYQPGVLFSCDIPTIPGGVPTCEEIIVDKTGNSFNHNNDDNFSYKDKKDNMWLGVSLDVQQGSRENNVVVCGHLWKNQFYRDHYLANGACYVMNSDLDSNRVEKLVPFVNKAKQSLSPPGIYYYAFGQAGTSVTFSDNGQYLLLGGPGYYDWIGTILSYKLDASREISHLKPPIIPDPPFDQKPSSDGYIGYSITSGNFFGGDTTYSAVGAPRDGNNHGRVYIFQPLSDSMKKFVVYQKKEGVQFGEYFGASVCGTDLNVDGLTDLLVGAPFHSTESGGDEGKVYVYISNTVGLQPFAELSGQKKPNARFGTSIGNVGDLNQDGFNDVAIGAVYEDENGAIYIYHGTSRGLNTQYVQRISAGDIRPSISGFGISISRGLDIDDNFYPDILVGSYSSSNAVLLRTHPVIYLTSKIEFDPPQITRNDTRCVYEGEKVFCFNVSYCIQYSGKHAPLSLEFDTELKMDSSKRSSSAPRGGFFVPGDDQSSVSKKANLDVGQPSCFQEAAFIYNNIRDVITPVQFFLSYKYSGTAVQEFCADCPVIDPSSSTDNAKAIPFQTDCGSDNTCRADLVVEAYVAGNPSNKALIIGQNSTLTLDIRISNRGEPAYLAELYINLPPQVLLVKQDLCNIMNDQQRQVRNATLQCDLGNPLKKDKAVNIQVKIDVKTIHFSTRSLNVYFEAITVSEEVNVADNKFNLPIFFKAVSDISITGNPEDGHIPLTEEKNIVSVTHKYYVMNHGPSPVNSIEILLYLPSMIEGNDGTMMDFLNFTGLVTDSGEPLTIPAKCNGSFPEVKETDASNVKKSKEEVFNEKDLVEVTTQVSGSSNNVTKLNGRRKRSILENTTPASRKREDFVVNCQTTRCIMIHCVAGPFPDDQKFTRIVIVTQIDLPVLSRTWESWSTIEFVTSGKIFMNGANIQPLTHRPDEVMVKSLILRPGLPPPKPVEKWIIFVSIGVGILLFVIILIILIKIGFFRRKQMEKMKNMMIQANLKRDTYLMSNEEKDETDDPSDNDIKKKNHA